MYFSLCSHLEFLNGCHDIQTEIVFSHISVEETYTLDFGIYSMFSGSMNPIKTIIIHYFHYFGMCWHLEFRNDHRRVWTDIGFAYYLDLSRKLVDT